MVQPLGNPQDLSTDFDHHVVLFPTRAAAHVPAELPVPPAGRSAVDLRVRVRTHAVRGVVVLQVVGRFSEVVDDLDRAIQLALAEGPRGVVCDLSEVLEGAEPKAVEVLATAGRHVRDWSGIPVAVACPDPLIRAELAAHTLGGHLIVTTSMFSAVSAVLATPTQAVGRLWLAPHPTAPRASREFVTRTLLDWGLAPLILSTNLVVSELVTSSTMQATTGIELSIAWNQGTLRLTVRDNSPDVPHQRYTHSGLRGSRLTALAGLSRAYGVLPTADGGKVVWTVLNAARPRTPTRPSGPEPATALQESAIFNNAPGSPRLPLFAGSSRSQADTPALQHRVETTRPPGEVPVHVNPMRRAHQRQARKLGSGT
jgi:hypothetical protein